MTAFLNDFLLTLAGISLSMALVAAILLLARGSMKKHLSAGSRYIIWCIVVLRLLLPVGGFFAPALINITDEAEASSISEEDFSYDHSPSGGGVQPVPEVEIPLREGASEEIIADIYEASSPEQTDVSKEQGDIFNIALSFVTSEKMTYAVSFLWAAGVLVFFIRYAAAYGVSMRRIGRASIAPDEVLSELFLQTCRRMDIKTPPRLIISEAVDSPMLYGFIRPTVVMPSICLEGEAAVGVISHELTHYKRGDLYVKLASMIGNALHWFNPIAYISARMLSSEMELSCDERVLAHFSDEERVSYGRAMLDIVKNCRKVTAPLSTSFNPASNAVKERLTNILDSRKKGKGISVISLTAAVCILSGSLFGYEAGAIDLTASESPWVNEETTGEAYIITPVTDEVTDTAETIHDEPAETFAETSYLVSDKETETAPDTAADTSASQRDGHDETSRSEVIFSPVKEESTSVESSVTPHIHKYSVTRVAATCSENGYNLYRCQCGHTYTTLINRTHAHKTKMVETTVAVDGEDVVYYAEICVDCGIEIGYKKSMWDGTSISYYISGPFNYDGEYNENGELVIYGKGDMQEYGSIVSAFEGGTDLKLPPWWLLSAGYDSIVVDTGITHVGANAFAYACEYVSTVKISKNCKSIGTNAFLGGTEIKTLYLPVSLEYISEGAFADSSDIVIKFEGTAEEFAKIDLGGLSYSSVEFNVSY